MKKNLALAEHDQSPVGPEDALRPEARLHPQQLAEGDYARVISPNGGITVPVAHMAALNPRTIWTWNAIGKRKGAWALDDGASEATTGFLLNHLISECLPAKGDGPRLSNSDPVTGQAAWFDLRVRIEKVGPKTQSEPAFDPIPRVVPQGGERAVPSSGASGFSSGDARGATTSMTRSGGTKP